jgi:hypothetical protein
MPEWLITPNPNFQTSGCTIWNFLQQLTTWFNKHQPLSELDYKAFVIKRGRNPRDMRDRYTEDLACCRFDGHRDRLIHATPASRSKSMGLL